MNETITSTQLLKPITGTAILKNVYHRAGSLHNFTQTRATDTTSNSVGTKRESRTIEIELNPPWTDWKNAAVVAWKKLFRHQFVFLAHQQRCRSPETRPLVNTARSLSCLHRSTGGGDSFLYANQGSIFRGRSRNWQQYKTCVMADRGARNLCCNRGTGELFRDSFLLAHNVCFSNEHWHKKTKKKTRKIMWCLVLIKTDCSDRLAFILHLFKLAQ